MPKFINPAGLPQPYVDAVVNDDYDAGDSDYTPSSLLRPPYMAALYREHDEKIEIDVADRFFALQGKMAHKLLEIQEKGGSAIAELRVYTQVNKWLIGMQFDRLHLDKGTMSLQDWKMTTVYKFKKDYSGNYPTVEDWEAQLNIGAFILRQGGYFYNSDGQKQQFKPVNIDKLEIVGLLRDWHLTDARRDKLYPQKPVVAREIKLWSNDEVAKFIHEKASAHDEAKKHPLHLIPPCTMEEMWAKDTTWAVMKIGGKRARKAGFETEQGALDYIEKTKGIDFGNHVAEKRPGARNRCQSYCDVAPFCPHFEKWAAENNPEALKEKRALREKFAKKLKPKP